MNKKSLNSEYVKSYYNKAVGALESSYTDFRWSLSSFSIVEYKQTKKTILHALGNKKFNSVLEIGGGDGAWTEFLIDRSDSITELDISDEMLERAKKRFSGKSNIKFTQGDFLENKLPSDAYNLVFAVRCFEYFSDKQKAVSELRRILKKDGELLVVTKNPDYVGWKRGKKTLHQGQISPESFIDLLKSTGFMIEEVKPAILGKKFDWFVPRLVFNAFHAISLSSIGWLIPEFIKKYFSESYLVLAKRL